MEPGPTQKQTPDVGSSPEKTLSEKRAEAGRKGGKRQTKKKAIAVRVNGALGGRPT